jgi:hypothetical protein
VGNTIVNNPVSSTNNFQEKKLEIEEEPMVKRDSRD